MGSGRVRQDEPDRLLQRRSANPAAEVGTAPENLVTPPDEVSPDQMQAGPSTIKYARSGSTFSCGLKHRVGQRHMLQKRRLATLDPAAIER